MDVRFWIESSGIQLHSGLLAKFTNPVTFIAKSLVGIERSEHLDLRM